MKLILKKKKNLRMREKDRELLVDVDDFNTLTNIFEVVNLFGPRKNWTEVYIPQQL